MEYNLQHKATDYLDIPTSFNYQPHIYELLGFLAQRSGVRYIIDIGCGSAAKLKPFVGKFELVGIDCAMALDISRRQVPEATFIEWDLESGLPDLLDEFLSSAVVVCGDVIEHLNNPEILTCALAKLSKLCPYLIVSTPDRTRSRGLLDDGPPSNPSHIREWSADEFGRFLRDCGFSPSFFIGHTINTDFHCVKTTTLVIAGTHAYKPSRSSNLSVASVIHVFNEQDILTEVVQHLKTNGVDVHIFDNWSTDGSYELAKSLRDQGLCANVQRFPSEPSTDYEWSRQLLYTAEYASSLEAQWVMHHDADELRYSPWQQTTLANAFAHIDALGYNAVDFTVIDFRFLRTIPEALPPYENALNWFEFGRRPGHFQQVKAWKNFNCAVDLASSGGHDAKFNDRRIFPLKFLLKHYPLRTRSQAEEKVFKNRLPRTLREQSEKGWHTQYIQYEALNEITGWEKHMLNPWHSKFFDSEFLVERLSGIGLHRINSSST
jgi:2-polyprenyl-3-methyl-5-hydroxy-6-metoxy-1,4-benzoquinol methylase